MPNQSEPLIGIVTDWSEPNEARNIPGKLYLKLENDEIVELTCYADKLAMISGLPDEPMRLKHASVVVTATESPPNPKATYRQFRPTAIKVIGQAPPQSQAQPERTAPTASAVSIPSDRETLIIDQVLFKGVIDLMVRGDADVDDAVKKVIYIWNGIRARHNSPDPDDGEAGNAGDDLGTIGGE